MLPELKPNIIRKLYDDLVLPGAFMGGRDEVKLVNYELFKADAATQEGGGES